ncbi:Hypothetical predicted protein [Olea europaea subsp. europaea]|uniref:Uncharacterized protein n=1 Tax=Olea europaea subsp. europaea TaxID=158383 RepID=A0A8S0TU80_OLEEU|nr:Hypothetical predicted protein [Olea europaea subsp. europaea]
MALVAHFLYGREVDWPLNSFQFLHNELTPELRLLHIIFCTNIYHTSQQTRFNEERARLLYHMARVPEVPLLPREESVAPDALISRRIIENSKARLRGAERVRRLELGPTEPQQVPDADIVLLSRQLSQMQATQVELGRSVGTMTNALEAMQTKSKYTSAVEGSS